VGEPPRAGSLPTAAPGPGSTSQSTNVPSGQPEKAGSSPPSSASDGDAPPRTVKEMVEKGNASTGKALEKTGQTAVDAVKSTGDALDNAGSAVSKAAKKTWRCLTTLFGEC
jgi:hypothetical protein